MEMDTGNFKEVFTSDETKQLRKRIEELTACKWPDAYTVIPVKLNGELHATSVPISNEIKMLRQQLAAHEAVIKQMRDIVWEVNKYVDQTYSDLIGNIGSEWLAARYVDKLSPILSTALSIQPTTEHLDAYVKEQLGEPVVFANAYDLQTVREHLDCWCSSSVYYDTPLYALKDGRDE